MTKTSERDRAIAEAVRDRIAQGLHNSEIAKLAMASDCRKAEPGRAPAYHRSDIYEQRAQALRDERDIAEALDLDAIIAAVDAQHPAPALSATMSAEEEASIRAAHKVGQFYNNDTIGTLLSELDAARAQLAAVAEAAANINRCIYYSDTYQQWVLAFPDRTRPALDALRSALADPAQAAREHDERVRAEERERVVDIASDLLGLSSPCWRRGRMHVPLPRMDARQAAPRPREPVVTRRDVAAMRLALEMLRLAYTGEYEVAHFHRVGAVDGAVDALRLANMHLLADALEGCGVDRKTMRATVARAALYLRARLRAEALERYDAWADDAPHESPRWRSPVCAGCAEHLPGYEVGDTTDAPCPKTGKREVARQCRPLWEQAAQWWATHERPGGGR